MTQIVRETTGDDVFTDFFRKAINVELSNLAELREKADKFPTHEIGVAQGNSLSPLLGNIILHDFDRQMNEGDCRCLRYVDDFIILAPTKNAAEARMRKAIKILGELGMALSPEKSSSTATLISDSFEFLGIELNNGLICPSRSAQEKLSAKIKAELDKSTANFRKLKSGQAVNKQHSLINTLKRVDGIVQGWGKHYRFCNDVRCFTNLDTDIGRLAVDRYLSNLQITEQTCRGGEVLTGPERRRRWTADEKARIVAESLAPEAVISVVARRHGVHPNQLSGWRREFRSVIMAADPFPAFVPITVAAAPGAKASRSVAGGPPSERIEIVIGMATVRVPTLVDEPTLRRVLAAVRGLQ